MVQPGVGGGQSVRTHSIPLYQNVTACTFRENKIIIKLHLFSGLMSCQPRYSQWIFPGWKINGLGHCESLSGRNLHNKVCDFKNY